MDGANRKQRVTGQNERICCQLDMVTDVYNHLGEIKSLRTD